MSKGKNNNKNNKVAKVPVKAQPMKQQKAAVVKNVQKVLAKPAKVDAIKKEVAKKDTKVANAKDLKNKKLLDLVESCDDDDESDVDYSDHSDMDDVDLGDSDSCDDVSIEDMDNSDYESIEIGEDESDEEFSDEEEVEIKPAKKVETKAEKKVEAKSDKKAEPKVEKKVEVKTDKKAEAKVEKKVEAKADKKADAKVEKKVEAKAEKKVETKSSKVEKVAENKEIDTNTEIGKILVEVNKRKNVLNECVVFVNKMHQNLSKESVLKMLEGTVSVININIPMKSKGKTKVNRGYGFIRVANADDSSKAIAFLNEKNVDGAKMSASKFVCKKIYNDGDKLSLTKVIVHSFIDEDITEELKNHFNVKVSKSMNTQYYLEFATKEDASAVFQMEKMILNGKELRFNYFYRLGAENTSEKVEEAPKVVAEPEAPVVKAGVKRANVESEDDAEIVVPKKTKVEVSGSPKKAIALAKKSEKKTPEPKQVKVEVVPAPKEDKKVMNKSPANKKQLKKSPVEKKSPMAANKAQNGKKPFNKGQNEKKPFNKAGNKNAKK